MLHLTSPKSLFWSPLRHNRLSPATRAFGINRFRCSWNSHRAHIQISLFSVAFGCPLATFDLDPSRAARFQYTHCRSGYLYALLCK
ncbi:hypothetical protein M408DRAFT_189397 [Serendipita vermifera MAFF 305830]|uniref:Uncharacterized protein n=1 Tax=Serendipita vermifera MAFF 305830 TaxID=933852 RepID=A0A0C3BNA1_SERVB|nr:hypothetical protein M408DRAFT_189397 [Serendipita vermifera MAFF 305830]